MGERAGVCMGERARAKERETERGGGKPINQATVLLPFPPLIQRQSKHNTELYLSGLQGIKDIVS